jgi:hypothetical protein
MKSAGHGTDTSGVELTNVSQYGLSLLIDGRERYLPYDRFPWFRHATIAQLSAIERRTPGHLHWPQLDVDLTLESIDRPQDFPLVSRGS